MADPAVREHGWLPRFDRISSDTARRAETALPLLPEQPYRRGGAVEFYAEAVYWAKRNDVILVNDNPYGEIAYDGYRTASILQAPGRDGCGRRVRLALETVQHDPAGASAWPWATLT